MSGVFEYKVDPKRPDVNFGKCGFCGGRLKPGDGLVHIEEQLARGVTPHGLVSSPSKTDAHFGCAEQKGLKPRQDGVWS